MRSRMLYNIMDEPLIKRPLFISSCILFFIHQILQKVFSVHIFWIDNYLDMFVLMPILIPAYSIEKKYLNLGYSNTLTNLEIFILTFIVGMMSEVVFPILSDKFFADYFDLLALSLGAVAFKIEKQVFNRINHTKVVL